MIQYRRLETSSLHTAGLSRSGYPGRAYGSAEVQAARGRLNFVFILTDDLGWADTGVYGADIHETPNIDRLAATGVRFTDACAAAPVCTPNRAAILTGKCPARLGMTIWREASADPPADRKLVPPVVASDLSHVARIWR